MLRTSLQRAAAAAASQSSSLLSRSAAPALRVAASQQTRSAHAISNPTLANIEKRWEAMPPQEQADLWMALRDRMKVDWHELTLAEKKAAYWIAFGPHGPRASTPPGENWKIFTYTMAAIGVTFFIFMGGRTMAGAQPKTMTREYQEASNQYLKDQGTEPITGYASEGYTGRGMIQSKPTRNH